MERRVRDVMTSEVVTVGEQASFKEIAATMAEHRVSALPVLDAEGRVAGIVSEADLLLKEEFAEGPAPGRLFQGRRQRVERAKAAGATAAELMTAPAVTVGPDAAVAEAARLLHRHGIKRLPVLDPAGPLLGIVSRADLLKVFLRSDAEIAQEVRQDVLVRAMWMSPDSDHRSGGRRRRHPERAAGAPELDPDHRRPRPRCGRRGRPAHLRGRRQPHHGPVRPPDESCPRGAPPDLAFSSSASSRGLRAPLRLLRPS
jgi:CBS domain-containing protein